MKDSFQEKNTLHHNFFQNGVYLPKRQIFIGSNPLKEDSEISFQDMVDFYKAFYILEEESQLPISVHLCTYGGDVYEAMGIYDMICNSLSPVYIYCVGSCMSAGTLFLQAATKRISYPNTTFMLHKAEMTEAKMTGRKKTKREKEEEAEDKRVLERMKRIYLTKLSLSEKELDKILAKDTFLSAEEAKEINLIDEIIYPSRKEKGGAFCSIKRKKMRM